MLRVPLDQLKPGMILARPIPLPNDPYHYLLQRDREIPADMLPRLRRLGIHEVWIRCRDLEFLECLIDEGLEERQRAVYQQVRKNFEAIIRGITTEIDLVHFEQAIGELFAFLKANANSGVLLQKLDAFDNYLMSHSTNVCYLSLLLGMKLEQYLADERPYMSAREARNLQLLGLGALLHDIGKMQVPPEILHKPQRLTPDEMAEMRRHTLYGFDMVKSVLPSPAAQVVLNHHQRWNGTGYPGRANQVTGEPLPPPAGRQIHVFSRIATVADIYDAATTHRCYSLAKLPVQVLFEMRTQCRGFFDPAVEKAFFHVVPPFPIGQIVELSDGVEAVVVDFNPEHTIRPKVQCLRTPDGYRYECPALEEIDLALYPELEIARVAGQDVREFTAALETAAVAV